MLSRLKMVKKIPADLQHLRKRLVQTLKYNVNKSTIFYKSRIVLFLQFCKKLSEYFSVDQRRLQKMEKYFLMDLETDSRLLLSSKN